MTLTEVEKQIAHLEIACKHLVTYGLHETAKVIGELRDEATKYADHLRGSVASESTGSGTSGDAGASDGAGNDPIAHHNV